MPLRGVLCLRPIVVAACAALIALPAAAQSGSDPFGLFGDRWQAGGLVYVSPRFEGARSYQVTGFPFVAPAGFGDDGIVQIKAADDVRFRVLQFSNFEVGPLAGYRFGRDEDDAAHLVGTGDIDGGLVLGAFATYRSGPLAFSVSYHHQATGDETGGLVRFGVEGVTRLSPAVKLTTGIGTNYATDDYMSAFFDVNGGPLPAYDASAGFKDVHVGTTATIDLSDRWTLILVGRYAHLIGDAADSPVVETESQFYGGAALSYKFSLGR
jgi:outer membrane scaffolding protein for murein synthesis (MipA/OmpV family)